MSISRCDGKSQEQKASEIRAICSSIEAASGDTLVLPLKEFNILIGNSEIPVTKAITLLTPHLIRDDVKLSFTDTGDLAEFIRLSEAGSYDLFILILNNVRWPEDRPGARIFKAIETIEQIRSRGNTGVIAISGYCLGQEFSDKVRQAGADYFLTLPLET